MKLPRSLCGTAKEVSALCRKHVTRFLRGGSWLDLQSELVDVVEAPGLLLLNGPSPLLNGEQHVHVYAPFWELGRAIDAEKATMEQTTHAFDAALAQPWSLLGLLSQANYRWLQDPIKAQRFLTATCEHWQSLDEVGARYTMGSRNGQRLWELPHLLKYVLANRGVATPTLLAPLPPGGLAELANLPVASPPI